jgi:hypothetical protein
MDLGSWLRQQLEQASEDQLREMVRTTAQALLSADVDRVCGAEYGTVSGERVNRRNGYRTRDWDTRVGTIELAIPKLRKGAYFPDWLLEPRRRAERALVQVIAMLTAQIDALEAALTERFEQHPDAKLYLSLPGLGIILGARVLGEFGDDPNRYAHAKARKNYAGSSPVTKQSGKHRVVLARFVRNRRLADALTWWAFCSRQSSPGARAFYQRHRDAGDTHHQALRALSNRWVGILHGCLRHRTAYDEHTAWGHRDAESATAA